MEDQVICPKCGAEFPLSEVFVHKIKEELSSEIEKKAKVKAEEEFSLELKDLQNQIKEKEKKLKESQELELEFRKKNRELKDREQNFDLEIQKAIDKKTEEIKVKAEERASEEYRLKDREKKELINTLNNKITDLKRKVEQGSQQLQGEVLELELEDVLRRAFPEDLITPVPKGVRGADVIQNVHLKNGKYCGTIIWETKRTKKWSDDWIKKLKADQRSLNADVAAICSTVMPHNTTNFSFMDGVCITEFKLTLPVAAMLRKQITTVARVKSLAEMRDDKKDLLYNYLTGNEFGHHLEAIVESFVGLQENLGKERRAMERVWKQREKEIDKAILGLAGLYGGMKGIIGSSMPEIESFELPSLIEAGDSEEEK